MSENKLDPANNRFERWYRNRQARRAERRRRPVWRYIAAILALLFIAEAAASAAVLMWYKSRAIHTAQFLEKFHLTRIFVSPFVFKNPVTSLTDARYIGSGARNCVASERFEADPLLGWRMRKNIGFLKQPFRVEDQVGWRFTNAQGFPSSGEYRFNYDKEKPEGVYRIIVTGGSTVEGDGAETPLASLPARLTAELAAREAELLPKGYKRFEVINAGAGGYRLFQEYLYAVSELADFKPDLLITYSGLNDFAYAKIFYDQRGIAQNPQRLPRHDELAVQLEQGYTVGGSLAMLWASAARNWDCFITDFALDFVAAKVWEKIEERLPKSSAAAPANKAAKSNDEHPYIEIGLRSYREGLTMMRDAADLKGFNLAAFLQPVMGYRDKPITDPAEREYVGILGARELEARRLYFSTAGNELRKVAALQRNHALCTADLTGVFEGVTERIWEDSRHVLAAGNTRIARAIVDGLVACGQLGRP